MKDRLDKVYLMICIVCCVAVLIFMFVFSFHGYYFGMSQQKSGQVQGNRTQETLAYEQQEAKPGEEGDLYTEQNADRLQEQKELCRQYDKLVVLDPGHGGSDAGATVDGLMEKELTLKVAKLAGELLEKEDVKVIYTREEDRAVADEERVRIANDVSADWFISIHTSFEQDSSIYGMEAKYNDSYFVPGLTSADFSYLLLEKVANSTNEKVLGLEASTEDVVVQKAQIPVAYLQIGYFSNAQERKLLSREDYLNKIAEGIRDGVLEAYSLQQEYINNAGENTQEANDDEN